MYFIDMHGDICYKSSIDRVYYFTRHSPSKWEFFGDWREFPEESIKRMYQISDKYRALRSICDFSVDKDK